jgi:uncharacterized protein (TIGR00369 family)
MSTEHHLPTKQQLMDFFHEFPFFQLIGMKVLDIEPGWSRLQIEYRHDLCQPAGIMHGGIIATLIDTGIAHALLMTEPYQEAFKKGGGIVSVDLRVKYLRPVSEGVIICESKIPRLGKQIIHGESIVTNEAGKEVARGDSIYMAVAGHQYQRRSD